MRLSRVIAALLGPLLCLEIAEPQIVTLTPKGDKTVICMHTGLTSDLRDCGARADWYTYAFVGSISSITAAEDGENELQIVPEEVFHGNPNDPLTVFTSQAACLPRLAVGDRWLFFLRKENGKPILLDYYGNDSVPIADAQEQIETLRRLQSIGERGIVRGHVIRDVWTQPKPVDQAVVIARGEVGDRQFAAITDLNGWYEFSPMPDDIYKITVQPVGSIQADDARLGVSPGSCWDLTLTRSPHAEIGGYVRYPDGAPAAGAEALIMPPDESSWSTAWIQANGHFQFDSLTEGNYVIGIRVPSAPPWESGGGAGVPPPLASLYYPGVPEHSAAVAITLRTDEKREDINFTIPQ